jgi:hypothetical protein
MLAEGFKVAAKYCARDWRVSLGEHDQKHLDRHLNSLCGQDSR